MNPSFLIWILTMTFAMTAHSAATRDQLRRLISSAQAHCPTLNCAFSPVQARSLSVAEFNNLETEIQSDLKYIASEMSQIWGDTILEGDYFSDEPAKLEKIEILSQGSLFLGYRITYSAPAWETSHCEVIAEDKTSLEKCQPGKIMESAFVTADRQGFFQDPLARATFVQ